MLVKLEEARFKELLKMMEFLSSLKGYELIWTTRWEGMIEHWTLKHKGQFIGRLSTTTHTIFYFNDEDINA